MKVRSTIQHSGHKYYSSGCCTCSDLSLHKVIPLFNEMTTWVLEGHWEHAFLASPSLTVWNHPSCSLSPSYKDTQFCTSSLEHQQPCCRIDSSSSTSYLCTNQCACSCSLLQASNTQGSLNSTHSMAFGLRILKSALLSCVIWWGHQSIYWMPCSEEWSKDPLDIHSLDSVPPLTVPTNRHFHQSHY